MSDLQTADDPQSPPTMPGPIQHAGKDRDHLRILAIFYFILGGLSMLGVLFAIFYLALGILFLVSGDTMFANDPNPPPPEVAMIMGWMFVGIAVLTMVLCGLIGGLQLYTGMSLLKQRRHTLCLVIAALTCLSVPLGTILGIFTFVVINRPSAKALFDANR